MDVLFTASLLDLDDELLRAGVLELCAHIGHVWLDRNRGKCSLGDGVDDGAAGLHGRNLTTESCCIAN